MALNAACVFEMRTTGDANNGGGFKTGASGSDFSQNDNPTATLTTLSVVNADTTKITVSLTDYTVTTNDVGNVYRNSGGSSTTGWYEITAADTALNTWTLDRSIGTAAQTCTGKMGGAISTFQDAFFETLEPGNVVHVKFGTYTVGAAISVAKDGAETAYIKITGYNTTRGDVPTGTSRPTIAAGANTFIFDDYWYFDNFIFTSSQTTGWKGDGGCTWENIKATNSSTGNAINLGNASISGTSAINCEAVSSGGTAIGGTSAGVIHGCYIHDSVNGINSDPLSIAFNIFDTITTKCILVGNTPSVINNNTFYGGGTAQGIGIDLNSVRKVMITNNIFNKLTTAITNVSVMVGLVDYNNFFGNTTDRTNVNVGAHDVAIDPGFVDAPNGNFAITGAI